MRGQNYSVLWNSAMFCSVKFVVFLFGVLDATWGEERSDKTVTDETLAKQWLQEVNETFHKLKNEELNAKWNYNTNISKENKYLWSEATGRREQYAEWAFKNGSRFDWKIFADPTIERFIALIEDQRPSSKTNDSAEAKLEELIGNMTTIYDTAEICKLDSGTAKGSCISETPGLTNLMATSRDWDELLWAWKSWRDVTGKEMKRVLFQNNITGCKDFGLHMGSENASACEDLWEQIKPLYQQLHAYIRRKLMDSYSKNSKDFPSTRQIPAHILGNIWAQQWGNIYGQVVPFPNSTVVNITKLLIYQGFHVLRMFREADSFFTSLGLPAMTPEFWNHSLLEKKKNETRNYSCHPSSNNFFNKHDFRIKMCTEVTEHYFALIHHQMGYIQYYMNYKYLPLLDQSAPNPAFAEAVGDVITLSAMTPKHLRKVNLLKDPTDDHGSDMNFLLKIALEKVAFLPYGYLIDKYRWDIASESISPENCNKEYWKLRCGMQGISPPVPRSEVDFDPGAKLHVAGKWHYIRYFLSGIIQFQFHKSLCEVAGHVGPLHKCDIYNSKAAGDKLREMMSLGKTKPWQDAMKIMTGQRNMDAGPLLEYFRPLQDWLKKENEGKDVGWDEECPVGSIQ